MLFWIGLAFATCKEDGVEGLLRHAKAMEQAFDDVEEALFEEEYAALNQAASCIRRKLTSRELLIWHRARALGEFFDREEVASAKSWAAVKLLSPNYRPPASWLVEGTQLKRAWVEAPMNAERIPLERAPAGGWVVDGQEINSVPASRAFVLQGFDARGALVHTDYHYSIAEVPQVDFEALDPTLRQRRTRAMHVAGSIFAASLGVGSASMFTLAAVEEQKVKSLDTPLGDVQKHAVQANTLSPVGLGLGIGAIGVGIATWTINW